MSFDLDTARRLIQVFELTALLAGIMNWNKLRHSFWKWLVVYIATIVFIETLGLIFIGYDLIVWNRYLYKFIGLPIQFLFFTWLINRALDGAYRRWAWLASAGYIISIVAEELWFINQDLPFFSFSYMIGCIVLLVNVLLYLGNLVRSERMLSYKQDLGFWVCMGIISFYIATFPFYGLFNTLATKKYQHIHIACSWISCFLDYLMYLLFAIGFICYKPKLK
jgi:hypothetical protein